jgi:hypothetical protein
MHYCEINGIKGAMVCVDQAKAFDSVDHTFITKTFKFFGFGDRFISWLQTIGTNRRACIILENGVKGPVFNLLKGTAQGDCPSPLIYNICAQILLFKIDLSPEIRRVDFAGPVPVLNQAQVNLPAIDQDFENESFYETGKNESFADDSTTCTLLEYADLYFLKKTLEKFSTLSGLKCNFEKTSIMRIGNLDGGSTRVFLNWDSKLWIRANFWVLISPIGLNCMKQTKTT